MTDVRTKLGRVDILQWLLVHRTSLIFYEAVNFCFQLQSFRGVEKNLDKEINVQDDFQKNCT